MSELRLNIEELHRNPNNIILISHPGNRKRTKCLIEADFDFSMSSTYEDTISLFQSGKLGELQQKLRKWADKAKRLNNVSGVETQQVLGNIRESLAQWTGSTKPVFAIPVTVLSYDPSIKTIDTVVDFLAGVTTDSGDNDLTLKAPGGYAADLTSTNVRGALKGTWAIQVAQYFRATGLVLLSANPVFSKEISAATNQPIMSKCVLTFTTALLPTVAEVRGWFLNYGGGA